MLQFLDKWNKRTMQLLRRQKRYVKTNHINAIKTGREKGPYLKWNKDGWEDMQRKVSFRTNKIGSDGVRYFMDL